MRVIAMVMIVSACGSSGAPQRPDASPDAAMNPAPATCGPGIYPCGPYGYSVGSTIENLMLIGQRDDNGNGHIDRDDRVVVLTLADLAAGAKALVIDICAEWCGPCRTDQPNLNAMAGTYGSAVVFFDVMLQDNVMHPGTLASVDRWGTSLTVPYPIAADPTALTAPYFPIAGFPMHLVIKTSDMTIAASEVGANDDLMAHIDGVLANP
jgi:hypothetical protein